MAKARKGKSGGRPAEMMVVASKVKAMVRSTADFNTASDAVTGLNQIVADLIVRATRRAARNGRRTVRADDF